MKRVLALAAIAAAASASAALAEGASGPAGTGFARLARGTTMQMQMARLGDPTVGVPGGQDVRTVPMRPQTRDDERVAGFRQELSREPVFRIVGQARNTVYDLPTGQVHLASGGDQWLVDVHPRAMVLGKDGRELNIQDVYEGEWIAVEGQLVGKDHLRVLTVQKMDNPMPNYPAAERTRTGLGRGPVVEVTGTGRELFVTPPAR